MGKITTVIIGIALVGFMLSSCGFAQKTADSQSQAQSILTPEMTQWIDSKFEQHFESEKLRSTGVVDDATFLRRISLDLSGRIPTVAALRDFSNDPNPKKRLEVIDQLLKSDRYGEHAARIWRRILIPPSANSNPALASALDEWLKQQLQQNTRFDVVARDLITAGGASGQTEADGKAEGDADSAYAPAAASPTGYLVSTGGQPAEMASSVSRVFLGVKLECAMCHDHPFTAWTQEDFWGVAAFFSGARLNRNQFSQFPTQTTEGPVVDSKTTRVTDTDGKTYSASLPWNEEKIKIPADELPRQYFAKWLTSKENPHFSATIVNRVWQDLCGDGLTYSVDDLDQATEAERKVLLDSLAEKFEESDFDLRELVRAVCASQHYQRPSDRIYESEFVPPRPLKVLTPEQLFDSLEVALALPVSKIDRGPRFNGLRDTLVARMEEAVGSRPGDFRSGIPQALTLMNGSITAEATDLGKSKTLRAIAEAPFLDVDQKVSTLFLATIGREPSSAERQRFVEQVASQQTEKEKGDVLSEIMWALINSPEFVLVR